ncbi:helix-turn-helix domain-containing protein [Corynebacterium sp. TA-R-1]|uniref:Helix-turn-helix domain-containing protein n=1 Tax=Corynebacterium stercoris TaxID=2943490 RepID=A0ABT1G3W7_9CORY|nr:helix-turn-helix transcriptional regulator [Corynebacterium stercoris]MCP1388714.1 helix-turn-helix domain-containing protein [Corynebacterium stercoris]
MNAGRVFIPTSEMLERHAEDLIDAQSDLRERLIELRTSSGKTQQEVAEIMGVTGALVADFESFSANPTMTTLRRYALAVGADVHYKVTRRSYSQTSHTAINGRFKSADWREPQIDWARRDLADA